MDPLAIVDDYAATTEWSAESLAHIRRDEEAPHAFVALRAVLNLHVPKSVPNIYPGAAPVTICAHCGYGWVCPTVDAIINHIPHESEVDK